MGPTLAYRMAKSLPDWSDSLAHKTEGTRTSQEDAERVGNSQH